MTFGWTLDFRQKKKVIFLFKKKIFCKLFKAVKKKSNEGGRGKKADYKKVWFRYWVDRKLYGSALNPKATCSHAFLLIELSDKSHQSKTHLESSPVADDRKPFYLKLCVDLMTVGEWTCYSFVGMEGWFAIYLLFFFFFEVRGYVVIMTARKAAGWGCKENGRGRKT